MTLALIGGIFLDLLLGDPRSLPHPVRWMGRLIDLLFNLADPRIRGAWARRAAGLGIAVATVGLSWLAGWALLLFLGRVWEPLAWAAGIWMVWTSLSLRDLVAHLKPVREALASGDIFAAREAVSQVVGRQTRELDGTGVIRAGLETLAENFSDGVAAPLFFILLLGPAGGWAYKAVNTLDSMLGYKHGPYKDLGLFPARLDDLANLIPARVSFLIMVGAAASLGLAPGRALRTGWAEHGKSSSPNAGWPEAALAGALGVSLLGPAIYGDSLVDKPFLNPSGQEPGLDDLVQGTTLVWTAGLMAYLAALSLSLL